MSITRRQFLKRAGIGVGAAVGVGAGVIPLSRTRYDQKHPHIAENHAQLPANGNTVVIMGGGLAGLQAGVELAARGFHVEVLEKTGTPGGKLKTWRDRTFGPADDPAKRDPNFKGYVREHGVHAVWGFYNNLREFLGRYGWQLEDVPSGESPYLFLDRDGSRAQIDITNALQPYGSLIQAFGIMDMGDYLAPEDRRATFRFLRNAASFDIADKRQRDYLDSITFLEWAEQWRLRDSVTHKIMDALIEMAFFDNAHSSSALSLANIFRLVSGAPRDMSINVYKNPPGETFLQPMVEFIEARGGQVHYNTEITDVEVEGGVVRSVTAKQIGDGRSKQTRCAICGALLGPNGEHLDKCPVCGANREMIWPLASAELVERRFSGDFFVSAMDVPASKVFYGDNPHAFGGIPYFDRMQDLQTVHVYVVNLWYEGQEHWKKAITHSNGSPSLNFFATGFEDLGITINWSLPKPFRDGMPRSLVSDYEGRDVSIIETQVANVITVAHLDDTQLADRFHQELKALIPDLPAYQSFYVNRWQRFAADRPGDQGNRPEVQSPFSNLLFAGDMPRIDHPAIDMEKTNVTAKMATNLILEKSGQEEGRSTTVGRRG